MTCNLNHTTIQSKFCPDCGVPVAEVGSPGALLKYLRALIDGRTTREETKREYRMWAEWVESKLNPKPHTDLHISQLNLGVRARKALIFAQCVTVNDLLGKTANDFLEIRNVGATTVHEIRQSLNEHGLALRGDPESKGVTP